MDLVEARQRGFTAATRHPWELARLEVVRRLIDGSVGLGPGAAVLDVGCGDTFVVEQLAATYPAAAFHAVDTAFTDDLIAHYRAHLQAKNVFVSSSLDTIALPPGQRISLILLMDVLEHIADDHGFLTQLLAHPALSADTRVLITVPAYQALFCSHDKALGHYRRYSNDQVRHLLERSGLAPLELGYFFSSLVPMRVVQVMKERLVGVPEGTETTGLVTWKGGSTTTAVLKNLLILDSRVSAALGRLGLTVPGLSNFAVCRKSA